MLCLHPYGLCVSVSKISWWLSSLGAAYTHCAEQPTDYNSPCVHKMHPSIYLQETREKKGQIVFMKVLCLHGKVLAAFRTAFMRRGQEPPPCQTKLVPATSKRNQPLAKSEPMNQSGDTTVITFFNNWLKVQCSKCERQDWEKKVLQTLQSVNKGGGECAPGIGAVILLLPLENNMVTW